MDLKYIGRFIIFFIKIQVPILKLTVYPVAKEAFTLWSNQIMCSNKHSGISNNIACYIQ